MSIGCDFTLFFGGGGGGGGDQEYIKIPQTEGEPWRPSKQMDQ